MSEVSLGAVVSLAEAADMVEHVGEKVSYIFKGEMGIGKSAILNTLADRFEDEYRYVYAETQTFDTGDVSGCPFTELINGVKVTRFAPNILTGVHSDKPIIFMADEIGKAMRPVQNSMLRLFQSHKVGEYSLPAGSRVFGTTNLAVEGLSDHVQQHAQNRVSMVEVRKPNSGEWITWAMSNSINPIVIAWVKKFPHCLASYKDGDGNPYISYPSKTEGAFVSPRSLENASHHMWVRGKLSDNAVAAGVRGCVGDAAAADLMTFAQTFDRLPSWEATIADPTGCMVPSAQDFAANYVTVFSGIQLVDKATLTPFMTYLKRLPKEYQGVFALNIQASPKRGVAQSNRTFINWTVENEWMI
ncbi:MAG: hypothetical protein JW384_03733 [Nitrosomonadaceae bacterium]|nr:hypothetical protein [Nitrosomonadaceae bacterium]